MLFDFNSNLSSDLFTSRSSVIDQLNTSILDELPSYQNNAIPRQPVNGRKTIQELKSVNANKYTYAYYGYTLQDLIMYGFNLPELKNALFSISELKSFYTFSKLEEEYVQGTVTLINFVEFGFIFNNISNYCPEC